MLDKETLPLVQNPLYNAEFLDGLRTQMLRFAFLQLQNKDWAEDAVQEALVSALNSIESFSGKSAFKTWVFSILKNKIADAFRSKKKFVELPNALSEDDEDPDFIFNVNGKWQQDERPSTWGNPEAALQDKHFWLVFEACLVHLPKNHGRVFMMREFIEMDTSEISSATNLSINNLNVMLYRARLKLRKCLERNWFVKGELTC